MLAFNKNYFTNIGFFLFCVTILTLGFFTEAEARARRHSDLLLFGEKYQKHLSENYDDIEKASILALQDWALYLGNIANKPKQKRPGEWAMQEQFFSDLFVKALGFTKKGLDHSQWTLESEYSTDVDATRPDGVLGFFSHDHDAEKVQVVIELKGFDTDLDLRQNRATDRRTPVDQAFSYAHKFDDVRWVIVSNFQEIRLYNKQSSKYALHFDLKTLPDNKQKLTLFLRLFSAKNLIAQKGSSETTRLYQAREAALKQISHDFYHDYRNLRLSTIKTILQQHPLAPEKVIAAAQLLIDRVLFIAFLEDTGLIPGKTIEHAYNADNPFNPVTRWENFLNLFTAMDIGNQALNIPSYNGGLFRRNDLIAQLDLPDTLLQKYKELADYDFASDLRVNILGQVFEQSISDLEQLKATLVDGDYQTKIDDNRRHDEGAYYTPDPVTAYIVAEVLAPYLAAIRASLGEATLPELKDGDLDVGIGDKGKGKRGDAKERVQAHIAFFEAYMQRLKSLRILDPSCGSGAFLVAAFDALVAEGKQVNRELEHLGAPVLFTRWDREILRNNLYGVDISAESVQITRLSLWLKIASNKEPLIALDDTIRVGNAVIADPMIDPVNAFDWHKAFPQVFAEGGFDIVLGNPPYIRQELISALKPGLKQFTTYAGRADLYVYFYELGYNLLKEGGYLGYIASNKWMRAGYGRKLRHFFTKKMRLIALIDKGQDDDIFKDATTYPAITIFRKQNPPIAAYDFVIADPPFDKARRFMSSEHLDDEAWLLHGPAFFALKQQIERIGIPLKDWDIIINRGITTGLNEAFFIDGAKRSTLIAADPKSADLIKPMLRGRDLEKWHVQWSGTWLLFIPQHFPLHNEVSVDDISQRAESAFQAQYPAIYAHLKRFESVLRRRSGHQEWYALQTWAAGHHAAFTQEKIIYPNTKNDTAFAIDRQNYYHNDMVFHITGTPQDLRYLTAILNSDLIFWYLRNTVSLAKGGSLRLFESHMRYVPIPQLDDISRQPFIDLAERLTGLYDEIEAIRRIFLDLLRQDFNLNRLSTKLNDWPYHSFKIMQIELAKSKIIMMDAIKDDWFDRFTRHKDKIEELKQQANQTQADLNQRVNILYGLTEVQIALIQ